MGGGEFVPILGGLVIFVMFEAAPFRAAAFFGSLSAPLSVCRVGGAGILIGGIPKNAVH